MKKALIAPYSLLMQLTSLASQADNLIVFSKYGQLLVPKIHHNHGQNAEVETSKDRVQKQMYDIKVFLHAGYVFDALGLGAMPLVVKHRL